VEGKGGGVGGLRTREQKNAKRKGRGQRCDVYMFVDGVGSVEAEAQEA